MRLHETCGASAYVLAAKKDTKHPSPPEKPMHSVPCCAKRVATLWFLALLPFQQRHTRVNKQELNTPNAIACSLPVLDLPPTTLEHAPRLLSLASGSFRKQLSHVQSNTRKIESNGEVVKHALQAQELSNRTQATLLKAQLNAMFIFWKKKNAHCELRIRVASKMCPTFEAHHSCKRCIDRTQLPCLQTVLQIAPFPEGAYH